jgi:hypothetical protein
MLGLGAIELKLNFVYNAGGYIRVEKHNLNSNASVLKCGLPKEEIKCARLCSSFVL